MTSRLNNLAAFPPKACQSRSHPRHLRGAGLSAASGLPTFRGAGGGLWRNYEATDLATPEAFAEDPGLAGHHALAALAKKKKNPIDFLSLPDPKT
ncbi:hypothetical protein N0V85_007112, partial [Neurospora sp. IMI 360204]